MQHESDSRATPFHSGMVAVVGRSNVGKSTLVNALVGHKVAIVSDKVQTTRSRIMGVLHAPSGQAVFLDTPGLFNPRNRLGEYMVKQIWRSLDGIDLGTLVLDMTAPTPWGEWEETLYSALKRTKAPVLVLANKIDALPADKLAAKLTLLPMSPDFCLSALTGDGLPALTDAILSRLPEGPAYFPEDSYCDQPVRVLCAEFIREAALQRLRDELPHGIGVEVARITQNDGDKALTTVEADIHVETNSHKRMVVGAGGSMIKAIGTAARGQLELLFDQQVLLKLFVRVTENWRNSAAALRELEYKND